MKHIYCKNRSKLAAVLSFLGGMIFFLPVSHACKAVCVGNVCEMECPSQVPPIPSANSPFSMPVIPGEFNRQMPVIPGSSSQNPGGSITRVPRLPPSPDRQVPPIPSGITVPPIPNAIPPMPGSLIAEPASICQIPNGIGWCDISHMNFKFGDNCLCGYLSGKAQ
jgi:hypothetical protein